MNDNNLNSNSINEEYNKLSSYNQAVADQAIRLVELINDSLRLSVKSNNPDTKVSRLELAKSRLQELIAIVTAHPFITLRQLDGVEKDINRLSEKYAYSGYYRDADLNAQAYTPNPALVLGVDHDDLIAGYRFSATMQMRTPLRILKMHGIIVNKNDPILSTQLEMQHGVWLRELRPLTIDDRTLPIFTSSTMASDIGQIPTNGGDYLRFLIQARTAIESNGSIEDRRQRLKQVLRKDEWSGYINKLWGRQAIIDRFFPAFINTLPSLPIDSRSALWRAGLSTTNKIAAATDRTQFTEKT